MYTKEQAELIVKLIKQKEQAREEARQKAREKMIKYLWWKIKNTQPDYITKRKDGCKIYEYYEYEEDEEYILNVLVGDGKILDWKRY